MGCIPLFFLVLCLSPSAMVPLALPLPEGALSLCQLLPSSPFLHCQPCMETGPGTYPSWSGLVPEIFWSLVWPLQFFLSLC